MPRDPIAEIDPIVARVAQRVKELFQQRGLLQTPVQTLETEQELAVVGREMADELMEAILVASIEARQDA